MVVSHSELLARAAVALATEMVAEDPPVMAIAAGTADGGTGTDATAVAAAFERADEGAGVVVLLDLGSAVMSAEMALEFLPGEHDVRLIPAPFVEGLVAAAVRAAAGAGIDEVVREATDALGPKRAQLAGSDETEGGTPDAASPGDVPDVDAADARGSVEVVNAAGMHARPAAAIAAAVGRLDARVWVGAGGTWADASSPTSLAVLAAAAGDTLEVVAEGPLARAGVDAVVALVESGFGEELATSTQVQPDHVGGERPAASLGVSPGRVVGPVRQGATPPEPPAERTVPEPERDHEADRIGPACAGASRQLREIAARATGQGAAILEASAAIAVDPALSGRARALCLEGRDAERAVWEAAGALAESLRGAGGLIAERATDVLDVRDRVIAVLAGREAGAVDEDRPARPSEPYVLIAHDIAPADVVALDPSVCLAIVTETGSETSHTAIIARERGIPAVAGARGATAIPPGTVVLVDGGTGELVVDPDPQ